MNSDTTIRNFESHGRQMPGDPGVPGRLTFAPDYKSDKSKVAQLFANTRATIEENERFDPVFSSGPTARWLDDILTHASKSGDVDKDFFYLGGPMSNIPGFNFPEFDRVGEILRAQDYNIVNPSELDDDKWRAEKMASATGTDTIVGNAACMQRDLVICSMPRCVGGIFLPGWHRSGGAKLESQVLAFYGKPLFEFHDATPADEPPQGEFTLLAINRDERLEYLELLEEQRSIEDTIQSIRESEQAQAEDEAWNSMHTLGEIDRKARI